MRMCMIAVILFSIGSFAGWDVHKSKASETLVIEMGHPISEGLVLAETMEKGKRNFAMSPFAGGKPLRVLKMKKKEYDKFYSTFQSIFQDLRKSEKGVTPCVSEMTVLQKVDGKEKYKEKLCLTTLNKFDQKLISSWYRLALNR